MFRGVTFFFFYQQQKSRISRVCAQWVRGEECCLCSQMTEAYKPRTGFWLDVEEEKRNELYALRHCHMIWR